MADQSLMALRASAFISISFSVSGWDSPIGT